ncbi:MAG: EAL domain-containing protein [Pseudomonadota bacterium]
MKLSYSQIQKIGLIVIILLLFILGSLIMVRESATLSTLENTSDFNNHDIPMISNISQQFLLFGLDFFRYDDDPQKQKTETKKDLDNIKTQLLSYQQSLSAGAQFHQKSIQPFFALPQEEYRRLLTAYYAYYATPYDYDQSYEYSRISKQLVENIISQSSKKISDVLLDSVKNQTARLTNEINRTTSSFTLLLALVLLIILIVIATLFSLNLLLNRTIKEIQKSTQKISEGNFNEPLKTMTHDDVGMLAKNIDQMRINLKSQVDTLKNEIKLREKSEEKITYLAYHDALTDMPNRLYFTKILEREIEKAKRSHQLLAILFIDVDDFKSINDTYGHDIGDLLIQKTAHRLKENIRTVDSITRIGGDEFIVLLSGIKDPQESLFIGQKLLATMSETYQLNNLIDVSITVSIGIALFPLSSDNLNELFKQADIALYRAKQSGRNNCQSYDNTLDQIYKEQMFFANLLPFALKKNQFYLVYQPIIDSRSEKVIGMEALLRWNLPSHGIVSPKIFIPIAEKSGIFKNLGLWVIKNAFKQLKIWQDQFDLAENYLSINLSAIQLDSNKLNQDIERLAQKTGIDIKRVGFELTESCIMQNFETSRQILHTLHHDGFKLLIDDFGTGFSSFAKLKELDFTTLKIDKSFIDDIGIHKVGERIIKSIIALAEALGLTIIAEGVETQKQLQFLKENKAYFIQGFYYSKPLNAEEMTQYLKNKQ